MLLLLLLLMMMLVLIKTRLWREKRQGGRGCGEAAMAAATVGRSFL